MLVRPKGGVRPTPSNPPGYAPVEIVGSLNEQAAKMATGQTNISLTLNPATVLPSPSL